MSTTTTLDLTLELGQTNEVINVTEEAPAVQADSTTVGGLVGQETIRSLPLTTRNYTQILDLSPGVQADVPNAGTLGRNTQDVYVNGGRAIDKQFPDEWRGSE